MLHVQSFDEAVTDGNMKSWWLGDTGCLHGNTAQFNWLEGD